MDKQQYIEFWIQIRDEAEAKGAWKIFWHAVAAINSLYGGVQS